MNVFMLHTVWFFFFECHPQHVTLFECYPQPEKVTFVSSLRLPTEIFKSYRVPHRKMLLR